MLVSVVERAEGEVLVGRGFSGPMSPETAGVCEDGESEH